MSLMNKIATFVIAAGLGCCLTGCDKAAPSGQTSSSTIQRVAGFDDYWFDGTAEINRYQLSQARYGAHYEGEAVLIFVTEPFLREKQVKADQANDPLAESVLKLNSTRSFTTGIYPYSTMTSVFSPVEVGTKPFPVKLTTSIQEWCGHTFTQANLKGGNYHTEVRSYFQVEGDRERKFVAALSEEAVFNRIRLAPDTLPVGEIQMIPSQIFGRFYKIPSEPSPATASVEEVENSTFTDQPHRLYRVGYVGIDREFTVAFSSDAPYQILGWSEGAKDGQTTALLQATRKIPYWSKNKPGDEVLRDEMDF